MTPAEAYFELIHTGRLTPFPAVYVIQRLRHGAWVTGHNLAHALDQSAQALWMRHKGSRQEAAQFVLLWAFPGSRVDTVHLDNSGTERQELAVTHCPHCASRLQIWAGEAENYCGHFSYDEDGDAIFVWTEDE